MTKEITMTGRLNGKIALITGSARGMGEAEAALFAAEGATVVVSDLDGDAAAATGAELGLDHLRLDVTDEGDWERAAAWLAHRHGRLDVLVNNAGTVQDRLARFDEVPLEQHRRLFAVNVDGPLLGMRATLPLLTASAGASVVNVASIDGVAGVAWLASYVASKHALVGLSRSIAIEVGPLGVRVNTILPGVIETPLVRSRGPEALARLDRTVSRQPLPRVGQPAEVAALALFLASDEASYCTGTEFRVDGGHLAGPHREAPAAQTAALAAAVRA